jgi:hypothetical protein
VLPMGTTQGEITLVYANKVSNASTKARERSKKNLDLWGRHVWPGAYLGSCQFSRLEDAVKLIASKGVASNSEAATSCCGDHGADLRWRWLV